MVSRHGRPASIRSASPHEAQARRRRTCSACRRSRATFPRWWAAPARTRSGAAAARCPTTRRSACRRSTCRERRAAPLRQPRALPPAGRTRAAPPVALAAARRCHEMQRAARKSRLPRPSSPTRGDHALRARVERASRGRRSIACTRCTPKPAARRSRSTSPAATNRSTRNERADLRRLQPAADRPTPQDDLDGGFVDAWAALSPGRPRQATFHLYDDEPPYLLRLRFRDCRAWCRG